MCLRICDHKSAVYGFFAEHRQKVTGTCRVLASCGNCPPRKGAGGAWNRISAWGSATSPRASVASAQRRYAVNPLSTAKSIWQRDARLSAGGTVRYTRMAGTPTPSRRSRKRARSARKPERLWCSRGILVIQSKPSPRRPMVFHPYGRFYRGWVDLIGLIISSAVLAAFVLRKVVRWWHPPSKEIHVGRKKTSRKTNGTSFKGIHSQNPSLLHGQQTSSKHCRVATNATRSD